MELAESPKAMRRSLKQYDVCFTRKGNRSFVRCIVNGKPRLFTSKSNSSFMSAKIRAIHIAINRLSEPPQIDTEVQVTPDHHHRRRESPPRDNQPTPPTSDNVYASSPDLLIIENTPSPQPLPPLPDNFLAASDLPPPPRRRPHQSRFSDSSYIPPAPRHFPRKPSHHNRGRYRASSLDHPSPNDIRSTMSHSPPAPIIFDHHEPACTRPKTPAPNCASTRENLAPPAPVKGHYVHPTRRGSLPSKTTAANNPFTREKRVAPLQVRGHFVHPSRRPFQKPKSTLIPPASSPTITALRQSFGRSLAKAMHAEGNNQQVVERKLTPLLIESLKKLYIDQVGEEKARTRMASGFAKPTLPPRRELTDRPQPHLRDKGNAPLPIKRRRNRNMPTYNAPRHKKLPHRTLKNAMNSNDYMQTTKSRPPNNTYNNTGYHTRYHDLNLGTQDQDATHIRESTPPADLPNLSRSNPQTQPQNQNPRSSHNQAHYQNRHRQNTPAHVRAAGCPSRPESDRNNLLPLVPPPRGVGVGAHRHYRQRHHNSNSRRRLEPTDIMHETSRTERSSTTENTSRGTKRSRTSSEANPGKITIKLTKPTKKRKKSADDKKSPTFDSSGVLLEGEEKYRVECDINYISKCYEALQQHPKVFRDLKFDPASPKKKVPLTQLHGIKAKVYTQNEAGERSRKLKCRKHAKTKRAAKRAAAGGLLLMMLEHYPELNGKQKESTNGEENGNSNSNDNNKDNKPAALEVPLLNAVGILYDLHKRDVIQEKPAYNAVQNEQWEVTCTVDIPSTSKDDAKDAKGQRKVIPYSAEAKHTKKKQATMIAAKNLLDKLIADGIKGCQGMLNTYLDPKSKNAQAKQGVDGDNDEEAAGYDEGDDDDDEQVEQTEQAAERKRRAFSAWLKNPGAEFRVPEGYVIKVAKSGRECKDFIDEHGEEKMGVYMESPDVYKSIIYGLHYFESRVNDDNMNIPMVAGECKVIALAVESGALVLEEPNFSSDEPWPPVSLMNLFRDPHAELCGYKLNAGEHALGFTPEYRHCIADVQTVANGLKSARDTRGAIHMPLADILPRWTGKTLSQQIIGGRCVDEKRIKTAVYTAAAVLAAYHHMCVERDAKIRNQIGTCSIRGFGDLMNLLGGRTQLFPVT